MEENNDWPKDEIDLADFFGCIQPKIRRIRRILSNKQEIAKGDDYKLSYHESNGREMYLWLENGAQKVAELCKTPQSVAFLESSGAAKRIRVRSEHNTMNIICASLDGIAEYKREFKVDNFRIDLYLPKHKIAIECDEDNHKYHSINREFGRQSYLELSLSCEFIRYNPDALDFNIGSVINQILTRIINNGA